MQHDEWRTPAWLFDKLNREFNFTVDLAATEANALCKQFIGKDSDSLSWKWSLWLTGWLFCNPPFSRLPEFVKHASHHWKLGSRIVLLLPGNATDRQWFHDFVIGSAREVRFSQGRPEYVRQDGSSGRPRFGTVVAVYGDPVTETVIRTL